MADSALRLISKTGREALDIENDMVRILGLVDWVRAIASEPNMHPIRRRFNLNAVGSYLACRKQREQLVRGTNSRPVSRCRFRVVECGAFRLDWLLELNQGFVEIPAVGSGTLIPDHTDSRFAIGTTLETGFQN